MGARTATPDGLTDIQSSIRADLKASDESGAPPLGHLAGLRRKNTRDGRYALELDAARPALTGGAGILECAMLVDLALGGVIRNQLGLALPMPTVSMTVQLAPGRTRDVSWADGECTIQVDRTATARSRLYAADGEVLGDAVGVFALPQLPYGGPSRAMPWDLPLDRSPTSSASNEDAASAVAAEHLELAERIYAHTVGAPVYAWGSEHVAEQLTRTKELVLTPTPPMTNRLGHVHGGVLFTTGVLAAAQIGGFPVETLTSGTIEFIEAADLNAPLVPEVTILRAGGRSLFASVVVTQRGQRRCHIATVFRR